MLALTTCLVPVQYMSRKSFESRKLPDEDIFVLILFRVFGIFIILVEIVYSWTYLLEICGASGPQLQDKLHLISAFLMIQFHIMSIQCFRCVSISNTYPDEVLYFCLFVTCSSVWRVSSLKSHSVSQNSKEAVTDADKGTELPGQLKTIWIW